jgi:hypothetical protein
LRTAATASPILHARNVKIEFPPCMNGATMISPFSKLLDLVVDGHFRKDRSGRLAFSPRVAFRDKAYFVDSPSDAVKIKAVVRMYQSASTLVSVLAYPVMMIVGLFLDDYAGLTPRGHRLQVSFGIPLFYALISSALLWMLCRFYKKAIFTFTSPLVEVGPDVMGQLTEISPRPRRILFAASACILLLLLLIIFAVTFSSIS